MEPWKEDKRLEADKLIAIAEVLRDVRNQTAELHDPVEGDNAWSLGTRVYARQIHVLEQKAMSTDWLTIRRKNLEFDMSINGVPVRFYKGEPEKPTKNTLKIRYEELQYQQLMMLDMGEIVSWRFAQETNYDGSVFRISLVKLDQAGISLGMWEVPLETTTRSVGIMGHLEDAIELSPAVAIPKDKAKIVRELENVG